MNKQQAKSLIPAFKGFNKVAKIFIQMLTKKIAEKEKRLSRIRVMVSDIALPQNHSSINITTVDINKTIVRQKGRMSFNQKMDWEEDFLKNRKRFII